MRENHPFNFRFDQLSSCASGVTVFKSERFQTHPRNVSKKVKDIIRLICSLCLWNGCSLMACSWQRRFIATCRQQRINVKCMTSYSTWVWNVRGLVMFADITGTPSELHWNCQPLSYGIKSCVRQLSWIKHWLYTKRK